MKKCCKCGAEKIVVAQRVIGFPNHYIEGTKKEYCGACDEAPVMHLDNAAQEGCVLVEDSTCSR